MTGRPETMSKKRRNFSAQFKLETVLDGLRGGKDIGADLPRTGHYRIAVLQMPRCLF